MSCSRCKSVEYHKDNLHAMVRYTGNEHGRNNCHDHLDNVPVVPCMRREVKHGIADVPNEVRGMVPRL